MVKLEDTYDAARESYSLCYVQIILHSWEPSIQQMDPVCEARLR